MSNINRFSPNAFASILADPAAYGLDQAAAKRLKLLKGFADQKKEDLGALIERYPDLQASYQSAYDRLQALTQGRSDSKKLDSFEYEGFPVSEILKPVPLKTAAQFFLSPEHGHLLDPVFVASITHKSPGWQYHNQVQQACILEAVHNAFTEDFKIGRRPKVLIIGVGPGNDLPLNELCELCDVTAVDIFSEFQKPLKKYNLNFETRDVTGNFLTVLYNLKRLNFFPTFDSFSGERFSGVFSYLLEIDPQFMITSILQEGESYDFVICSMMMTQLYDANTRIFYKDIIQKTGFHNLFLAEFEELMSQSRIGGGFFSTEMVRKNFSAKPPQPMIDYCFKNNKNFSALSSIQDVLQLPFMEFPSIHEWKMELVKKDLEYEVQACVVGKDAAWMKKYKANALANGSKFQASSLLKARGLI